jgi:hypothetical protein
MRDAITMLKSLLLLMTVSLCACGQQAASKQTQAPESKQQTHAAATSQKGQIAQPAVAPGKITDGSSLLVSFHGCADLLLIDSRGRKLGFDPASQKSYLEISGGIYDEGDPTVDDEDDAKQQGREKTPGKQLDCVADKTIQFPNPVPGMYMLTMGGQTDTAFKLEITSYGADAKANGHFILSQPAGSTSHLAYQFQLPPTRAGELQVKTISK